MFQLHQGIPYICISILLMLAAVNGIADEHDLESDGEVDVSESRLQSEPANSGQVYRTREEKREAGGVQREITSWLSLTTLLEGELHYEEFASTVDYPDIKVNEGSASLQFGLFVDLFALAEAEVVLEYDTEVDKFLADEALITFEYEPWELSLGKQYTPFGVYFSHFVTDPLLEFAKTRSRRVVNLAYGPNDAFDLSLALYQGLARETGRHPKQWDWALSLESWPTPNLSLGLSYQSDLADADERLLEDVDDRYSERVSAISGYLLWLGKQFELSFEFVTATDDFQELEANQNKPMAWNAEFVHFIPGADFEVAFRIEHSRELAEAPKLQYGIAITRYEGKYASLTLEYLHAKFEEEFYAIEVNDEIPVLKSDSFGAKVTFEF